MNKRKKSKRFLLKKKDTEKIEEIIIVKVKS